MGSTEGHITEDLLVRYLLEECNAAERAQVEEWINADKANRDKFYALKKAWDISVGGQVLPEIDVDAAWQKVSTKTQPGGGGKVIELDTKRRFNWTYAAAAVALVLVGLFFFNQLGDTPVESQFAANKEFVSQQLADNSLIVLSPNSKVEASIGDERKVKLEGKAYFEVAPDKEKPFTVETEQILVTVLGTAFNVEEQEKGVRTEVREGKVRMEVDGAFIELKAGEVGFYDAETGTLKFITPNEVQTWGDKTIVFNGTPLGEVVEHLQIFYPVEIDLANEQLANCRLTATFTDEQISDVLRVIASTFDLELKQISSNAFELDGEGC